MRRVLFLIVSLCATLLVQGAWYWPFGSKEDDPSKPLRLHRLLEEANNYIEIAEDEAMKGNGEKAVENYRLALGELDRVERENPERAETAEFSPLRNKRAACVAAMDAIRFAQVDENERAVSVTDTRELQKKWNKKHGIKEDKADKDIKEDRATKDDNDLKDDKDTDVVKDEKDEKDDKDTKVVKDQKVEKADKDTKEDKELADNKNLKAATKLEPSKPPEPEDEVVDFKYRLKMAIAEVRNKDYVAADVLLEDLLKEKPNDLNLLMLRAGAQAGMGSQFAARRTLEKAMRTYPRSYLPYYNLANLSLQMGEDVSIARQYYEIGRTVGGPPQAALEAKLNAGKSESK